MSSGKTEVLTGAGSAHEEQAKSTSSFLFFLFQELTVSKYLRHGVLTSGSFEPSLDCFRNMILVVQSLSHI